MNFNKIFPFVLVVSMLAACTNPPEKQSTTSTQQPKTSFEVASPEATGINFSNRIIKEDQTFNCFNFFNIYNGGGVAVGDINNDGLPDVYFTGNQVENKLYLNKGNLTFEDITQSSNVAGKKSWTTGVTMADVNGDGWLDIYVCQSGGAEASSEELKNLLYINNGDLSFTERAEEFGIADDARTNHAAFFDFDKDGDLDVYVVNHPLGFGDFIKTRLTKAQNPTDAQTDKLFRNDGNNKFTEVTNGARLRNYGFGLSASVSDFNNDGWPDIYVANDYSEPDHYYLNNGDGTFRDDIHTSMKHISQFSMGSDAADINNDGRTDLLVLDMMAEDNFRKKTNMQGMDIQAFYTNFGLGRHLQYMQNVLQLNRGQNRFSEIAELSGVAYTDWSWSPLICDLDNDGNKDIYITNGIKRDLRNNDFQKSIAGLSLKYIEEHYEEITEQIPSKPIDNYVFQNKDNLTFKKSNADWGLTYSGFSSGSAYADLDNDGDLDLVVNNLEDHASVFENRTENANYLRIQLKGGQQNTCGIGSKAMLVTKTDTQYAELNLSHGFLSSSEPIIHFGLGNQTKIELLKITWPDGKESKLKNVDGNQTLTLNHADTKTKSTNNEVNKNQSQFQDITTLSGIDFKHQEVYYEDYDREILLPHRYSQLGPFVSVGDVNNDGLEDFFVGSASQQAGVLYLQQKNNRFIKATSQPWQAHAVQEDMSSIFMDIDNDNDLDLYVASGSNEWDAGSNNYQDRMYINDGNGAFSYNPKALPPNTTSSGIVTKCDFDNDGDFDLFVGGRITPGKYPLAPSSYLLTNENGSFKNLSEKLAPEFKNLGLVTDAIWADIDNDNDQDLIITGEWMPITIFENTDGTFTNITKTTGLDKNVGWWYSLSAGDFDKDGDIDFVAGNLGLNSKYQVNEGPIQVYAGDLDKNGSHDIILGYHSNGDCYPVRGRTCSSQQMPSVSKKISTYNLFGKSTLFDVYGDELSKAYFKEANWLATSYIENLGNNQFKTTALPNMAQLSAVNAVVPWDVNKDENLDIILSGNMHSAEIETARHDASYGLVLLGNGKGEFVSIPNLKSGINISGDIKDLEIIEARNKSILVTENHGTLRLIQLP